jgi:hypothetical protein
MRKTQGSFEYSVFEPFLGLPYQYPYFLEGTIRVNNQDSYFSSLRTIKWRKVIRFKSRYLRVREQ